LLHKYQELDYGRNRQDFGVLGERAEVIAVSGVRNVASGISPARWRSMRSDLG